MDRAEREQLVARYKAGHQAVVAALEGLSEADLDAREALGEWSPRQIAHHLADSEMTAAMRLRLLIAEDRPTIVGYDQRRFVDRLSFDRPIAHSLEAFRFARATTAEILDRLDEDDWQREGTHSESGRYAVEDWLRIYAAHAHDHADQIRRAVAAER